MQYDQVSFFPKDGPFSPKDGLDAASKALSAVSQGAQAIAVEATDFAKKAVDQGTAAFETLSGAKSLEKAVEVQSAYLRASYEGLVAQASRMGTLYANLAKDTMKPFEAFVAARTPNA